MDLSIFYAKLFGFYFLLMGLIFIWRRESIMPIFEEFAGKKTLMFVIAVFEILAGLAIVISHNIWEYDFRIVVTIIGYWLLIEGVLYLLLPGRTGKKVIKNVVKIFSRPGWYISGSLIGIILGIYLLNAAYMF